MSFSPYSALPYSAREGEDQELLSKYATKADQEALKRELTEELTHKKTAGRGDSSQPSKPLLVFGMKRSRHPGLIQVVCIAIREGMD